MGRPLVKRTRLYLPSTRLPYRVKAILSLDQVSTSYDPRSQIWIIPAPYSPSGILPSKSPKEISWSSTWMAKRLAIKVLTEKGTDGPLQARVRFLAKQWPSKEFAVLDP